MPSDAVVLDGEDQAHYILSLLTRDFLHVLELTEAIRTGDFGHIEDTLATRYHGILVPDIPTSLIT